MQEDTTDLTLEEKSWWDGYVEMQARIQAHPLFHSMLRSVHTRPNSWVPSRRSARVATRICEDLELNPAVWRGNVFGAAAAYVAEHGAP